MQVRDFMIYNVFTATPSTTVKELISLFEKKRIGGVPVVDDEGKLVGIISDGDVIRYLSPNKQSLFLQYYLSYVHDADFEYVLREKMNTPINEIMVKRNIITLMPHESFERALELLSKHHFKKIPVVNGVGRVVGIVSLGDIIYTISRKIFENEE